MSDGGFHFEWGLTARADGDFDHSVPLDSGPSSFHDHEYSDSESTALPGSAPVSAAPADSEWDYIA